MPSDSSKDLSLHGVEEKSDNRWKAVVVGSYERGDRAVTVQKLAELADFYGVPVSELLARQQSRGCRRAAACDSSSIWNSSMLCPPRRPDPWRGMRRPSKVNVATTTDACCRFAKKTCAPRGHLRPVSRGTDRTAHHVGRVNPEARRAISD